MNAGPRMASGLGESLSRDGYASVGGADMASFLPGSSELDALAAEWDELGVDEHLPGEVKYRFRRYGRLTLTHGGDLEALPQRPFVQSVDNVPTYDGRPREFAPLASSACANQLLADLIRFLGDEASELWPGVPVWEVGVHMVRLVVAPDTAVSPTPEGRHRDGHSLIGMHLIGRERCEGGETLVYGSGGDLLASTTLRQPLDSLIVDDERVEHAVTDLTGTHSSIAGRRDLLIVALYPPAGSAADGI